MYCDYSDIVSEIGELDVVTYTDDTNSGSLDQGNFDKCVEWAEETIINSTLRKVFVVPFGVPIPREITSMSIDLTIYKLFERRGRQDKQQHRYDRAMAKLKALRSGTDVLDVELPEDSKLSGTVASGAVKGSVFTGTVLGGY